MPGNELVAQFREARSGGRSRHGAAAGIVRNLLTALTVGYFALGKAFGYVGYYPFLIGEFALIICLLVGLGWIPLRVPRTTSMWILALFVISGFLQGVYSYLSIGQSAAEVLRGLAPIYYTLYALLAYLALSTARQRDSQWALRTASRTLSPLILAGLTISAVCYTYFPDELPRFWKTGVPMLFFKSTDAAIPLGIILALSLRRYGQVKYGFWALLLFAASAARSRSALLCLLTWVAILWRPRKIQELGLGVGVVMLGLLFSVLDVRVDLVYREMSAAQYVANLGSLVGLGEAREFDSTTFDNAQWRWKWWMDIVDSSIENDEYFMGKGWGTNLATTFGRASYADEERMIDVLRNPHSMLFSTLGRGGWAMAILWVGFYVCLFLDLTRTLKSKHLTGERRTWLLLCGYAITASVINGLTDVFLESPQNAIPHWIIVGCSWALVDGSANVRFVRVTGCPPEYTSGLL